MDDRVPMPQTGPFKVADYTDKSLVGKNWEIAHFGECGHHNRNIWVTTDNVHASETNGACPCDDAAFLVWCRNNRERIVAALGVSVDTTGGGK